MSSLSIASTLHRDRADLTYRVPALPPPTPPMRRVRVPTPLPSALDLTGVARAIAAETNLRNAAFLLQREVCRLTGLTEAMFVIFDWVHRSAWTVDGEITSATVRELVAGVAGSGRRVVVGSALVEPIGAAPARAVLALRRPLGGGFDSREVAMISALVGGISRSIDRLIGAHP